MRYQEFSNICVESDCLVEERFLLRDGLCESFEAWHQDICQQVVDRFEVPENGGLADAGVFGQVLDGIAVFQRESA